MLRQLCQGSLPGTGLLAASTISLSRAFVYREGTSVATRKRTFRVQFLRCRQRRYCSLPAGTSSKRRKIFFPLLLASETISSAPLDGPPIRRQASHRTTNSREIG